MTECLRRTTTALCALVVLGVASPRQAHPLPALGFPQFPTRIDAATAGLPAAQAWADFDLDGDADVVVSAPGAKHIQILMQTSPGVFTPSTPVDLVGRTPVGLTVADVDSDGDMDVVLALEETRRVNLFINQGGAQGGTAGVLTATALPELPGRPTAVATIPRSGGGADIAVTFTTNSSRHFVAFLPRTGPGTYGALAGAVELATSPGALAVADMTADGRADLVVALPAARRLLVVENRGSGVFATGPLLTVSNNADSVAVGDWNGDGLADLASCSAVVAGASVLMNSLSSPGTFTLSSVTLPTACKALGSGDVEGAGRDSLLAASATAGTVTVLSYSGSPATWVTRATLPGPVAMTSPVVVDVDGDGDREVAACCPLFRVRIWVNRGGMQGGSPGAFHLWDAFAAGDSTADPRGALCAADLTNNGIPDLVVANNARTAGVARVFVFCNQTPQGTHANPVFATPLEMTMPDFPQDVAAADMNNDGHRDVVALGSHLGVAVFRNSGDGTAFDAARRFAVAGSFPRALAVADLNGDGLPDVATADTGSSGVSVLLNTPAEPGKLGAPREIRVSVEPRSLAAGDLNGNGHTDLAVANYGGIDPATALPVPGSVSILHNNGSGVFSLAQSVDVSTPTRVLCADVEGDAALEIVVVSEGERRVFILARTNSTWGVSSSYDLGAAPLTAMVADLDSDHDPDLAAADHLRGELVLLRAAGGRQPAATPRYSSQTIARFGCAPKPVSLCAADFDGDGDADVAALSAPGNTVSILPNLTNPTPEVSWSPASIDFGTHLLGAALQQRTLLVKNEGFVPASVTLTLTPDAAGLISAGPPMGANLPVGGQVQVPVRFSPTVLATSTGTLNLVTDDPERPTGIVTLNARCTENIPPTAVAWHDDFTQVGSMRLRLDARDAHSGIASVQIHLKRAGETWASAGSVIGNEWGWTPPTPADSYDGVYLYAIVATDGEGNKNPLPTDDATTSRVLFNAGADTDFTYANLTGTAPHLFPMRDAEDVTLQLSAQSMASGVTISRTHGAAAPPAGISAQYLGERLNLRGNLSGSYLLQWQVSPANLTALGGAPDFVVLVDAGGNVSGLLDIAPPVNNSISVPWLDRFGTLYAGRRVSPVEDWRLY